MAERAWTPAMREISGFGKDGGDGLKYERCCQAMVLAGVAWFDEHPDANPEFKSFRNVFGVLVDDNADATALSKAMTDAAEPLGGATGAMHQAAVAHVLRIREVGWEQYVRESEELERAGGGS